MMQIIIYAIGLIIGLLISSVLLISVTTRKKRSKRNKLLRIIAADVIIAVTILVLYPYHMKEMKSIPILWMMPALITLLLNIIALNKFFSGERPDQEILNAWHDNPANWKFGIFYYNPDDHRIFPPKKNRRLWMDHKLCKCLFNPCNDSYTRFNFRFDYLFGNHLYVKLKCLNPSWK
jgi:choline-glycine betaine transporter